MTDIIIVQEHRGVPGTEILIAINLTYTEVIIAINLTDTEVIAINLSRHRK